MELIGPWYLQEDQRIDNSETASKDQENSNCQEKYYLKNLKVTLNLKEEIEAEIEGAEMIEEVITEDATIVVVITEEETIAVREETIGTEETTKEVLLRRTQLDNII